MSTTYRVALVCFVVTSFPVTHGAADELADLKQRIETLESARIYDLPSTDHWVQSGSETASFILPGTSTTLKVGGYTKLDGIFDFDDAGDRFLFEPSSIPIGAERGQQLTFHARQTRLNLDAKTPTEYGNLRLFVEGDFFGVGNSFRLRHGYGELGDLLAGQTWILAVDAEAIPETLDFNGPDGALLARRAQVRWTTQPSDNVTWACSLHDPRIEIETTVPGQRRERFPVFSSSVRVRHDSGHFYLSGGAGANRFVPDVGAATETAIWGVGISTMQRLGDDKLIAQLGVTEGFSEFLPTFLQGESASVATPGELEALFAYGLVVAYQHAWCDTIRSNVAFRSVSEDNSPLQPADSIHRNDYLAVNFIWSPLKDRQVDIGIEYLWGLRENKDGMHADANRLQFSAIFRLP